jgi:transcriptional regulator with XRE-family HTH domain
MRITMPVVRTFEQSRRRHLAIAHNLDQARRKKGLTQAALAAQLGVATTTVSRWCTGASFIKPTWLERMAQILSTTAAELRDEAISVDASRQSPSPDSFEELIRFANERGFAVTFTPLVPGSTPLTAP